MKEITLMRHFKPDMKECGKLSLKEFMLYSDGIIDPCIDDSYNYFHPGELDVDIIYFSPADRCSKTAHIVYSKIRKRPIAMMRKSRLREASFLNSGIKEEEWNGGKTWEEKLSLVIDNWFCSPEYYECSTRLDFFLEQLKKSKKNNVLIVSHGFVLRMLEYKIKGEKLTKEILKNSKWEYGEIKTLEWRY